MLGLGQKSFDLYDNHFGSVFRLDTLIVRGLKALCIFDLTPAPASSGTWLPLYNMLAREFAILSDILPGVGSSLLVKLVSFILA